MIQYTSATCNIDTSNSGGIRLKLTSIDRCFQACQTKRGQFVRSRLVARCKQSDRPDMDSIISFKDDLKPRFITSSFSEDYIPKEEEEAYERPDHEHSKQLSPGLAIVSSLMCVGYSWLAYLGTLKVLEVLEEGMQNLDTSKTPVAAARSALDQMVVGSGFLLVSLFGLYSVGLLVYVNHATRQTNNILPMQRQRQVML
eukprot:CAMPEP_0114233312 /NCGR_PEP_ID=MMETSP0058-20121206/5092_1 /TAXON_ID=36894 /ORGANISM="Pyramimonas parkeae, CCMP726" /LENGTH=198 /DNA_ID=CAMNT_0001344883 /DNA_START=36 /DNA_END=632 /DNA_ORIENTATION=-